MTKEELLEEKRHTKDVYEELKQLEDIARRYKHLLHYQKEDSKQAWEKRDLSSIINDLNSIVFTSQILTENLWIHLEALNSTLCLAEMREERERNENSK